MDQRIEKLISGDEAVFSSLMTEYYPRLFNFAKGYLDRLDAIREILQDTFLTLWEKREKLKSDTNISAYLFTLTRNNCLDYLKHRKIELRLMSKKHEDYYYLTTNIHALLDDSLDILMAKDLEYEISNAISSLPEQCRKVFLKSRIDGLKYKEIATELNISEKTVEVHISKALRDIRTHLKKYYPEILLIDLIICQLV